MRPSIKYNLSIIYVVGLHVFAILCTPLFFVSYLTRLIKAKVIYTIMRLLKGSIISNG
jgi:hypothetical protein